VPPPDFSDFRSHIITLRDAALRAADPAAAVRRCLIEKDLDCSGRIFLVGAGKAGVAMARTAEELLGDRISAGVVSVPILPELPLTHVEFLLGGHPIPTAGSLSAGIAIARLLKNIRGDDLVLVLLSGGGSALAELPRPGIPLEDLQSANRLFLKSGASIREINCLRSPLSLLKAGGLARLACPACVLGLILSDVVGNSLEAIASGPTVFRNYTSLEIAAILDKYHLRKTLPPSILNCLDQYAGQAPGPVPPNARIENRLIASNRIAGEAAGAAAERLGFHLEYLSDDWQGEARDAGRRFADLLIQTVGRGPACCIAGGETTVTVRGAGIGGRNLEAALAAAIVLDRKPDIALATLATDGVDGPTDAAGAVVTGQTIDRARGMVLDPVQFLKNNDSYSFFSALGDLTVTGPTGTNVGDLWFGLVYR
jgi:glycerate 2-kinase